MRTIAVLSLAASLLAAGTLWGQAPQIDPDEAPAFLDIDSDHDGAITRDEARQLPPLHDAFDEADLDESGAIEPQEYLDAVGKTHVG